MTARRDTVRRLVESGLTDREIAVELGSTKDAVSRIRQKLGMPSNWAPPSAQHGLASTYSAGGCRCEPCRKANTERHRRVIAALRRKEADQIPHGFNGYTNYKCRCEICCQAGAQHNHDSYARGIRPDMHGRAVNIRAGCNCQLCAPVLARRRKASNEASGLTAANAHKQWTGPEMELLLRRDLSSGQLARILGRTLYAVKGKRSRISQDRPWEAFLAGTRGTPL